MRPWATTVPETANPTLHALRGQGLITLRGGKLMIEEWAGLQAAGEFDPG
jgi:hypothetical protein